MPEVIRKFLMASARAEIAECNYMCGSGKRGPKCHYGEGGVCFVGDLLKAREAVCKFYKMDPHAPDIYPREKDPVFET